MSEKYSTICPNCKNEQELFEKVEILMKKKKKSIASFACDSCGYFSAVIIDGKDIFYKNSIIKEK